MYKTHQLTIRGIDEATKIQLQHRARQQGKSLNAFTVDLLRHGAGVGEPRFSNGLGQLAGSMPKDAKVDAALRAQRQAEPESKDNYGF